MICIKRGDGCKGAQRTHRYSAPFYGMMWRDASETKPLYPVKAIGYSPNKESSIDHDRLFDKAG
jgi:hypothetical protein